MALSLLWVDLTSFYDLLYNVYEYTNQLDDLVNRQSVYAYTYSVNVSSFTLDFIIEYITPKLIIYSCMSNSLPYNLLSNNGYSNI